MVCYLKNPNLHDQKLHHAIKEGSGRLTPIEFTKPESLYLTLTSLLRQDKIKYHKHNLVDGFESYIVEEWPYSQPYPIQRYGA